MKLVKVRLRNLRCYSGEVSVELGDLVMVAGRNDAGKSTLFDGLAAFFGELKLDQDDACKFGDNTDVRIICEFEEYPPAIDIDAGYTTSLADEYLLNAEGRLELHQIWNCKLKTPKSAMYAHAFHPSVPKYNDLMSLKNKELKQRASELGIDLGDVDKKVNAQLRAKIWANAECLEPQNKLIPLEEDTGKQIWNQLKLVLPTFALFKADRASTDSDPEAQDPMKAAMKEAFKKMEPMLESVVEEVRSQVQDTADKTLDKLREMHPRLANQLEARFSEPNWANVMKVSLTGDSDIPINKRGSGVRRLVLINFFRAKAESLALGRGDSVPIIYAIEEPETSQHPENQKLLMKAFLELAASSGCQLFLTTHNPSLARRVPIGCIRYICEGDNCRVVHDGNATTMQMISRDLGVLPDHEVKLFIGVEGVNDMNFLQNLAQVLLLHGEAVPDLRKLEDRGIVVFIPCGGANLALWSSRLAALNVPEFHIFDGDKPEYRQSIDIVNQREACTGVLTRKREMENYLHPNAIAAVRPELEGLVFDDQDDVPLLVARAVRRVSNPDVPWEELDAVQQKKKMSRAKLWLNNAAALAMTPDLLDERDPEGEVRGWFSMISEYVF